MQLIARRNEAEVWLHQGMPAPALRLPFADQEFGCILFLDRDALSPADRAALSRQLLEAGCRYAVCAGTGSLDMEEAIISASLEDEASADAPPIITSAYEDEPVQQVIFHGLADETAEQLGLDLHLVLTIGPQVQTLRQSILEAVRAAWDDAAAA